MTPLEPRAELEVAEGRLRRKAQRPKAYLLVAAIAVLLWIVGVAGLGLTFRP